jgi:small subunit ribosomal protein S1
MKNDKQENPMNNENNEENDKKYFENDSDGDSIEDGMNFAQMLESYESGMKDDIRVGDKIRGRIVSITGDSVFVNTGSKADGIVEKEELLDDEGHLSYAVGDQLELFAVAVSESEIRLSRAIAGVGGLEMLKDALANKIPVEGKVIQTVKGGFQVEVLKRRAFCPVSQIDTVYVEAPETYVGNTFPFLIKKLTEGGRNIVISRRELLEAEQKKVRDAFMQTLEADQSYHGRVTRIMPYGAFIELASGVEGMVHISEISWSRLDSPEQAVKVGDQVQVKVLRIEPGPKQKKIALSIKQVLGDPWDRIQSEIKIGQKINGRVTRCAKFGAFVEIKPGIEGLVHISELSYTQRVLKTEDIVQPGQTIAVLIKEIDPAKRRVSLSLRDAQGDPWLNVEEKYASGQSVAGQVESKENFGLFISLEPGVVGLLPKSEINRHPDAAKVDRLKPGNAITVTVDKVQAAERKISLKMGDAADEGNWKNFVAEKQTGSLGSLGEQLAKAMRNNKK